MSLNGKITSGNDFEVLKPKMCFEVFSENKCRDIGVSFLLSQPMKGRKIEQTLFFQFCLFFNHTSEIVSFSMFFENFRNFHYSGLPLVSHYY